MDTFIEVINAWPSPAAFGADIGISADHVRTMRSRDSIPAGLWTLIMVSAQARGIDSVSLELFADLAKVRRLA